MFKASVARLAKMSSRRAGRSCSGAAAVEGEVPGAQQSENRKVDGWCDELGDPDGYAQAEREVEDVAEAEQEGEADDDAHDHGDRLSDRGST